MRNLLGQFQEKKTPVHALDPRIKIVLVLLLSIGIFALNTTKAMTLASLGMLFVLIIAQMSPITLLRNILPLSYFLVFIIAMYLLFSPEKIQEGMLTIWRFMLLIVLSSILTFSTTISDLIYGLEKLLAPLWIIGVSPRNVSVMISTTIRFIPLLTYEANAVRDAQESRGASLHKPKHIAAFVSSLLMRTFRRASNLADAMGSRCYNDVNYSHMKQLRFSLRDSIAILIVASAMVVLR